MLSRIADRLVLCPSTDPIDPEERQRQLIETSNGEMEAWVYRHNAFQTKPDVVALKFPGAGGRAERGGPHPFELWKDVESEVWTVNHGGYGGSQGVATLQSFASTCEAAWHRIRTDHPGTPIILIGNSLGCISALYLAARYDAAGVYLRNPVPLHQLISTRPRYNWWSFGMAKLIANQIPDELDAVENARQSKCPGFFTRSEADRVIPAKYQKLVFDAFGNEKSEFVLEGADHHHPIPEPQVKDYVAMVTALKSSWLS